MNSASEQLRRAQPLTAKAVGFIFDQGVAVWANWDRLIVRTEQNQVLLDYEIHRYMLHSRMEFVDNRYLVVPFGTDIMVAGFKVYDFQFGQWTLDIEFEIHNESGFCGVHPAVAVIAVEQDEKLELWDLLTAQRVSVMAISDSANVAALGGPGDKIAIGAWENILIIDQGREVLSARVCMGDVTALAWSVSQTSLLLGDAGGNFMQIEAAALQVTHSFGRVSGGIEKIRVSPDGKIAIAIGYDGQALLVACADGWIAQMADVFDAAFSPDDADFLLVAGSVGMRRLAISSLRA
ncbi:MAG: WD40 repeat domain-containing protein [Pseudomonas sp.]|uniref:WD40 repeat domain-containing protein n=1 Tax=Pseudomonas sp. TaxID=306 RepID=UPI0033923A4E